VSVSASVPPITKLQNYLGVTDAAFTAHESRYFTALKEHLVRAGTIGQSDTLDRSNFAAAVEDFQRSQGLTRDGIPGEDTLWALQQGWAAGRNLAIRRATADVWLRPPMTVADHDPNQHGYDSFRFRDDAAVRYDSLRAEVTAAGARITSSGSFRDLSATVGANRSAKSFHYSGLAFDLATPTGMQDPDIDPYIVTVDGDRWRVWARTDSGTARTLEAVVWASGATTTRQVQANVIDFTDAAERHGFHRIPPRSGFPASRLAAEWWHFQADDLLVPWISQFGIELLSLAQYDEAALRAATNIWSNRKAIFERLPVGRGWH
jgi:peptidoglycan hydrolase-like protein with peptidoglycan-binding domain